MSDNILVVAAHGDDEALGCGGTMARHARRGDRVAVLFVADGETARGAGDVGGREAAARAAADCLGAEPPVFLRLPDNKLDTVPLLEVVQAIELVAGRVAPSVVYTHHAGDLNIDHQIVHRAAMTAFRPTPTQTVRAIYGFEVASSTDWPGPSLGAPFWPTHVVDITAQTAAKRAALDCYAAEMRTFPHSRSVEAVEALTRLRGAQVGVAAAEAFTVLRQIDKD
jgi:LmbE family N-acetylglucosaminyl deacetylase